MQSVALRKAVPGDERLLSLVGQASFLETFAGILSGQDVVSHCIQQHSPEKYEAWLRDNATTVWLAEIAPQQAPIGYLVLTKPDLPLPDLGPEDSEIKRIYILHRFQGQGVGAKLMEEAERFAAASKIRRLLLGVYSKNTAAVAFYHKLGYKNVGHRSFRVGENTYEDFILEFPVKA
jgi:ribosomal protein S18 acetylase RimI-like enzyme